MKRVILSVCVVTCFLAPAAALACDGASHQASSIEPQAATVAQVIDWTKAKAATPVDANGPQTRAAQGVIPGAVLLTSSSQYDLKELPADKNGKLVFYCANQMCSASHAAARRAIEAGYSDVTVLAAGISGWKSAGQPTSKPNS
jgi:rhodanese-related sulfurtransferase